MARVKITEFGVIQKLLAGATAQIFLASDSGESTGVLASLYKQSTGSTRLNNPQVLDEDGKLSIDCYVENLVVAEISNISDAAYRSLSRIKANPLEYPLGATNASYSGVSVQNVVEGYVTEAQGYADQTQVYFEKIEETFSGAPSSTSVVLGTGTKVFTIEAGLPFSAGQYILMSSIASPSTHNMNGQITSYIGTILTVSVDYSLGSGTRADWMIRSSGPRGAQGPTGPSGPGTGDMLKSDNLSGLASVSTSRTNLGLGDVATMNVADVRTIPQNSKSANYTLIAADVGKHIYHPVADANNRTITIPANASVPFAIGSAITFVNMSVNALTIDITSDTMYLAGSGATGSRSIAQYGEATALKISSTEWIISGVGLS